MSVNLTSSFLQNARGITLTTNSVGNYLAAFNHNTLNSYYSDNGSGNWFAPKQFRGNASFNLSAIATGVTNLGSITVPGAHAFGSVSSAGNVRVTAYNPTAGALNFGAITLNLRIIKQ